MAKTEETGNALRKDGKNKQVTRKAGKKYKRFCVLALYLFGMAFVITETSPYSFGNFRKLSLYNCFMPI